MPDENKEYYVKYGQGSAVKIVDEDGTVIDPFEKQLDDLGFTHPNLHRRTDIADPPVDPEALPRDYEFGIYSIYSYKTKKLNYHDEESETSEIP